MSEPGIWLMTNESQRLAIWTSLSQNWSVCRKGDIHYSFIPLQLLLLTTIVKQSVKMQWPPLLFSLNHPALRLSPIPPVIACLPSIEESWRRTYISCQTSSGPHLISSLPPTHFQALTSQLPQKSQTQALVEPINKCKSSTCQPHSLHSIFSLSFISFTSKILE